MNSEFLNGTARDEHDSRLRGHFCKNTRSMVSTVNFGMNDEKFCPSWIDRQICRNPHLSLLLDEG